MATTTQAHNTKSGSMEGKKMDERNELDENETSTHPFFGTANELVNRYTHCALCGANLHFTHLTDFSKNLTQEVASCPECGVKAKRMVHRLQ